MWDSQKYIKNKNLNGCSLASFHCARAWNNWILLIELLLRNYTLHFWIHTQMQRKKDFCDGFFRKFSPENKLVCYRGRKYCSQLLLCGFESWMFEIKRSSKRGSVGDMGKEINLNRYWKLGNKTFSFLYSKSIVWNRIALSKPFERRQ